MSLSVTDEVVALIQAAAAPIAPARRSAFYERVSDLLRSDSDFIPHRVRAACAQAQREFLNAPPEVDPPRP